MGIEDRDYFREDNAKKKGMIYNRKNATYSASEKLFSDACRPSRFSFRGYFPGLYRPSPFRLLLQIVFTIAISGAVFVAIKIISQIFR